MICLVALLKLPSPNKELVKEVLGNDLDVDNQESSECIVAHRGACLDAPENSLEAVRLAAKNGAKWIEFDVSFTKDMVAVAFHDDTLDRITLASGKVSDHSFAEIQLLDLAAKHPLGGDNFSNVKIPTVEQFVAECIRYGMKMIIDLKTWSHPDETVELILSLRRKYPAFMKKLSII